MSRIPQIDPARTTGKVADVFAKLPVHLNIFKMMAHAQTCFVPQIKLGTAILSAQDLSASNRELLILQVANLQGGAYEWHQHVPIAQSVGISDGKIDALAQNQPDSDVFEAAETALLHFGRQVIENVRVDDDVFAAMQAHFSEQEIVEAILTIGFYMTMARLTEVTQTDMDPPAGISVVPPRITEGQ